MHCTILRNILHKTHDFLIAKTKTILLLVELISEKMSPYSKIFNKRNLVTFDKKMLDRSESTKMPKMKLISPENKHTFFTQFQSGI